ncbi:carnitine O-palmitoyltransferase 2, mitochondrial [Scaptodrosophila lebanonensis]|uniref:Carnitine O-palmitoyltransferase 2, mitochondrial n=1 Tax=Drosophila lebanonensis TaxID=7225 RepID=A0A6J2T656_DROLE|nr:carnitine O-palmitoyltransferase 2, mitochondrial [Scaptodrosophila lebanonensis]
MLKLNLQRKSANIGNLLLSRSATTTTTHGSHYQYLQRSKLPTMYFQRSLPRLPVPLLEKTCERFLTAVQPILTSTEHSATQQVVEEFRQGVGMELHARLKQSDEANKHTSYISKPWFDMYLSDRAPLPLNYNPLLVLKSDTRPQYQQQLVRATNLIISSLRFWRSLQADLLEPEVYHMNSKKSDTPAYRRWMSVAPKAFATYASYAFKAFPLDMSQYNQLFGTSRIPRIGKDELVQSPNSKHILVMRRGYMYAVNVLDSSGYIESPSVILGRLQAVLKQDAEREPTDVPLGVLTTAQRDEWARARAHFVSSSKNADLLEREVDSALFCVCLDSAEDGVFDEANQVPLLKHLLAGKAQNRWFDKSISLLICADGTTAVNFEHSWGDGVAVLRYFNELYKDTLQQPYVDTATVPTPAIGANIVRALNFEFDDTTRGAVAAAYAQNASIVDSLEMNLLRYPQLNKGACKRYGLSPDSIMQLSFQLAYRQAFDRYVGTYESCSTSAFRHGRTETMRPCTLATKAFCEAVLQPAQRQPSASELRAMIDKCSSVHGQLTKEAAMGQGFDRHLFALKNIAQLEGLSLPKLYETEAYKRINYNIISTSTLGSDALLAGSFGPVVRDGLGIGYSIQNDFAGAVVTSYKNQAKGKEFVDSLENAFNKIRAIIEQSSSGRRK